MRLTSYKVENVDAVRAISLIKRIYLFDLLQEYSDFNTILAKIQPE